MNCLYKFQSLFGLPKFWEVTDPIGYDLVRFDDFTFLSEFWRTSLPWQIQGDFVYDPDQVTVLQVNQLQLRLNYHPDHYLAGCVCTARPFLTAGYRVQIKARWDAVRGFSPALWLWSEPASREYDIVECNDGKRVFCTAHRWGENIHGQQGRFSKKLKVDHWHIYEIELLEDRVNWYINGQMVMTHRKWPPDNPMMLIMSVGCTSDYYERINKPAMYIDWVKIFQYETE